MQYDLTPAGVPEAVMADVASIEFSVRDHPARQFIRDPSSGAPLEDPHSGQPITAPMFPDDRGLYANGMLVGYCGSRPGRPLNLIGCFPPQFVELAIEAVARESGRPNRVSMPPPQRMLRELDQAGQVEDDDDP